MYQKKAVMAILLALMVGLLSSCAELGSGPEHDLLANGLADWQQIGGREGSWKFEDGILYTGGGGGGWLSTRQEYANFKLELEFRVPPGGNSGVFVRAPHEGNPAYEGMEIQVLDDYAQVYANLRPSQYTGSIYDVQAPSTRATKKAHDWQKMVIVCNGPRVQVIVNGTVIVDTDVSEHADKLATHSGLARTKGYIGLQNHGSRLDYRNIKITELK